ncbi:ST3 beta-galactoside alpha-2,3-sialyltransferase 8 isoform X2 [Channa argus]|uniref:ST3 beta-galactoside alpha-2,3-sialyltransferase 8 isoform X2 n=1 Tax=Channa argus TaxID=215402 RepID=UPI0035227D13
MFLRRKLWVAVVVAAFLFLILLSQIIQERCFLLIYLVPSNKGVSPTRKETDPGGSDWFGKHYDPKQQPILQDNMKTFDQVTLKWWLGLQQSGNDKSLNKVMSKMFQVISPPTGNFGPAPSRCRRCAVVGNSGNLWKSGYGKRIDTYDYVIRMNKAVTQGFEKDVGYRTTHHFLYPESAVDVKQGVSLVLLPFKLKDLEWITSALSTGEVNMTYMKVKERVKADKDKVLVVNPEFFKYVHDNWTEHNGRYPSTGMLAIIFALHICDQVSVFGFGADQQGNWHHYWEKNLYAGAFRKTGVHNAEVEHNIIRRLDKEHKITLHPGYNQMTYQPADVPTD